MQVKYNLTEDDLLHFYRDTFRRAYGMHCGFLIAFGVLLGIGGLIGALVAVTNWSHGWGFHGDFFVSIGLIIWGVRMIFQYSDWNLRRLIQIQEAKRPGGLGEHVITITSEWLREVSPANDTKAGWQDVHSIASDDHSVLITVGQGAYVIPGRAFVSPDETKHFFETAKAYWRSALERNSITPAPDTVIGLPPLDVTYCLDSHDLWAFNKYVYLRRAMRPAFLYALIVIVSVVCVGDLLIFFLDWRQHGVFQSAAVIPVLCILGGCVWVRFAIVIRAKAAGYGETVTLRVTPEYLLLSTKLGEAKLSWQAVQDVIDDRKRIYIFQNPRFAFIVPKRAFSDAASPSVFFQQCRAYCQNADSHSQSQEEGVWPPPPRRTV